MVILAGLAGSGKSTQVPQFLLEEKEEKEEEEDDPINGGGGGSNNPCHPPNGIWEQRRQQRLQRRQPYIVVTQPQCIRAVSLAHRIAKERGWPPPGAEGSSVGYMVHNNRRGHLPSCQIIYMTIGILLKMLVPDQGGAAVAADDVDNGGLLYGDDNVDNKE